MYWYSLLLIFIVAVSYYAGRNKPRPTGRRVVANVSIGLLAVASLAYVYYPGELDEVAETASLEIIFKKQEARLLANQMRGFELGDLKVGIHAPDSRTWIVTGLEPDVKVMRNLARVLDTGLVTPEHTVRTYEIEHHDARSLANAIRGRFPKGQNYGILALSESSWYVIVKQEEVEALESWLAEIDSPDLRITSEGVLESI